jgi:hypothetical protein
MLGFPHLPFGMGKRWRQAQDASQQQLTKHRKSPKDI